MRFLGNKESMMPEIVELLDRKGLNNKKLTFYDSFCGSGAVSNALKGKYNIIIGDMLNWCVIYTSGRLYAPECGFKKLGFNPFEYLNANTKILKGFFYLNYSNGGSDRMYFTSGNAGRIDYIRNEIEKWKNEKPFVFHSADFNKDICDFSSQILGKAEDVVENVECDIIYMVLFG